MLSGEFAESEPKDFSEPIDEGDQAEDYGYYSDSDLEDDGDEVNAGKAHEKSPLESNSSHPLRSPTVNKEPAPTYGEWKEPLGRGAVIKVHDIAVSHHVGFTK